MPKGLRSPPRFAIAALGLCPAGDPPAITLPAGRYAHVFRWDGVNWSGPSDTGQPKGAPFPAGVYTLTLRAAGTSVSEILSNPHPFEVLGTLQITLVP